MVCVEVKIVSSVAAFLLVLCCLCRIDSLAVLPASFSSQDASKILSHSQSLKSATKVTVPEKLEITYMFFFFKILNCFLDFAVRQCLHFWGFRCVQRCLCEGNATIS